MKHYICVIDSLGQCKYLQGVISVLHSHDIDHSQQSFMDGIVSSSNTYENRGLENTCFACDIQGNSISIIDRDTNCNLQN